MLTIPMSYTCLQDVYRLQTDDFDEPETLEVYYNDGKGGTLREIVFVDPIYADRRPRICVSIDGIQAMHKTISTLTRKVDNLVDTLQKCRGAYYKELSMLREQIYQQNLALRHGGFPQQMSATLYDPSAYISQTESEVDMEVKKKTDQLSTRVSGLEVENLRLKKRVAILSIEVTHLERLGEDKNRWHRSGKTWTTPDITGKGSFVRESKAPKNAKAVEPAVAEKMAAALPFGANFVRQNMRGRRTCASKGSGSKAKAVNRLYGKDGRMKRKYSNAPGPITGAPTTRRQERALKHQHQTLSAIRNCSLLKFKTKNEQRSFSDALTPELLATLEDETDNLAESRPPDEGDAPDPSTGKNPTSTSPACPEEVIRVLREVFGHESFRPGQMEAVLSLLELKRTLLLLATGSGKSLCYQLPAYLLREEGLTLVVSPLVSLMQDQLARLPKCLRGAVISSHQSRDTSKEVMKAVRARLVDVLFVSPERLGLWSFDGCGLPPIALACIDEAHCVSEWSHNFRPEYMRLNEYLQGALKAKRVLALTATATKPTVQSVCDILNLDFVVRRDRSFSVPELLAESSQLKVQRSNLAMDVRTVPDLDLQTRELIKVIRNEVDAKASVVIYVWRKATANQLAKQLQPFVKGGVSAYHGGMTPDVRSVVQSNFMSGKLRVVVATVAFGMGLDKPDIRLVVHFGMPKSIENYIQETGRCARDGQPGKCIALVSPQDYRMMRWQESGGAGGGTKMPLVRKLLVALLRETSETYQRHVLSQDALRLAGKSPEDLPKGWQPYCISLDEKLVAREMMCGTDELHSVLAHLCRYAVGYVSLISAFPTKLRLRFFRSDPEELAAVDPLLRQVLPLTKKRGGVHSLNTAQAIATMGGTAGQLSQALFQARGDEFSVEKAEFGYMVSVLQPVSDSQLEEWAAEISSINVRARDLSLEKLDAAFIALTSAAEARERQQVADPDSTELASDQTLNGLIDTYFAVLRAEK
eukprot:symbB.v1.2.025930.t2/scaffold2553.1/size78617/4